MDFLRFFGLFSKLLMLLLKITEVTTEHQKWPRTSTNIVKSLGLRPKPSKGARSKPALRSVAGCTI